MSIYFTRMAFAPEYVAHVLNENYVERLIVGACGEDAAGRLHTARSRNDIDMTMYRMRGRELILGLAAATFDLRRTLLDLAGRHRKTVFTVHTHTQRGQPTTVAHYRLADASARL